MLVQPVSFSFIGIHNVIFLMDETILFLVILDCNRRQKMNFSEAIQFIEKSNTKGIVLGLEAIRTLLDRLGNPQKELKFIHIAGTNGKGSVGTYISSVLAHAGYRTGRYVSPVIFEYCERIQILKGNQCRYISEESVADKMGQIEKVVSSMEQEGLPVPTAFELETAMAFLEFLDQKCDYVVLETGLGGIEDATNVIEHVELAVLTSISMDHMQFLGETITEITEKKAGIIKDGVDAICYDYRTCEGGQEIQAVIEKTCKTKKATCINADFAQLEFKSLSLEKTVFSYQGVVYETKLLGENQPKNAAVALEVLKYMQKRKCNITDEAIEEGIRSAQWKGRFSIVSQKPLVIADGAHNEDAAKSLAKTLHLYFGERKAVFVIGVFADKEYEKILKITAPYAKKVYTIQTDNKRALSSDALAKIAKKYVKEVMDAGTVEHALELACKANDDVIITFGSLSFVEEVYRYFDV